MKESNRKRKFNKTYYIFVEGETERWYFEHLERLINSYEFKNQNVKFVIKRIRWPESAAKSVVSIYPVDCFQVFDFEGTSDEDETNFERILSEYRDIRKYHSNVNYSLGYSNLTFELWMILHRKNIEGHVANKHSYLKYINKAFSKSFISLNDFKDEKNFKAILSEYIHLEDIKIAIRNAEKIRERKVLSKAKANEMCKFKYYIDNPDCTIHECVKTIFNDCGIEI